MTNDEMNDFFYLKKKFNYEHSLWGIFKDRYTLKITDNLSFSLLHYDMRAKFMRAKWRVIKRWNMSPKEPLNKFLKIITESEHIIQKSNIDAL
jgi:hypothetical protein